MADTTTDNIGAIKRWFIGNLPTCIAYKVPNFQVVSVIKSEYWAEHMDEPIGQYYKYLYNKYVDEINNVTSVDYYKSSTTQKVWGKFVADNLKPNTISGRYGKSPLWMRMQTIDESNVTEANDFQDCFWSSQEGFQWIVNDKPVKMVGCLVRGYYTYGDYTTGLRETPMYMVSFYAHVGNNQWQCFGQYSFYQISGYVGYENPNPNDRFMRFTENTFRQRESNPESPDYNYEVGFGVSQIYLSTNINGQTDDLATANQVLNTIYKTIQPQGSTVLTDNVSDITAYSADNSDNRTKGSIFIPFGYQSIITYFPWNSVELSFPIFKFTDGNIPTGIKYDIYRKPPDPAPPDPENPLDPGGSSTTGGGNGTFDDTSEPVDFAPLPSLTALNSGFVGLYAPTLSQLQGLSNYLWNENFNLDQLKKLFADPMDLLISLTIVPLNPPITMQENIKVGFISTGLPMNKVEQQFISYDFGSLEIKPYFDSALDFSPFTKISIYLPYIGLRQLNVDEIMGQTIHLQYNIDLFTGSCVAEIKVKDSVLYTFNGNLASSIPLTAGNFSNFLSATMNVAATIGLAATTGGAVGATSIASATANLISSAKPNIEHTGSISSTTGYLSNKVPYLVYEIPRQSLPHKYQDYVGYPSNITSKLSDLKGYTEIESIHLENIPATTQELTEIESLLKQGVIL